MDEIKVIFRQFYKQLLSIYQEREASHIAHLVFEQVTGLSRLDIITKAHHTLTQSQKDELNIKCHHLLHHKPVQYVLNECTFYHLSFFVDENVLIPRPETEELVGWIIHSFSGDQGQRHEIPVILDAGTGSGCIAVVLKKNLPRTTVLALDKSKDALQVARKNANTHHADISFFQGDLLENNWFGALPPIDILVSNPPYIPQSEKTSMQKNVADFEPDLALFVPDEDPLRFYKALIACARQKLVPGGNLFLEVHEDLARAVSRLLQKNHFHVELRKDMSGKDRMIRAGKNTWQPGQLHGQIA